MLIPNEAGITPFSIYDASADDADLTFTAATRYMANTLFPHGFDVGDNAPNTLEALARHYAATGRMLMSKAHDECGVFTLAEDYQAFRAWHDWTHLTLGAAFTEEGETAVAYAQCAMLAAVYGPEKAARWTHLVERLIFTFNFGDTFLPKQIGGLPTCAIRLHHA